MPSQRHTTLAGRNQVSTCRRVRQTAPLIHRRVADSGLFNKFWSNESVVRREALPVNRHQAMSLEVTEASVSQRRNGNRAVQMTVLVCDADSAGHRSPLTATLIVVRHQRRLALAIVVLTSKNAGNKSKRAASLPHVGRSRRVQLQGIIDRFGTERLSTSSRSES